MIKKFVYGMILGCAAFLLASCGDKPKQDDVLAKETPVAVAPPEAKKAPPAKADKREVKLHVEGMVERLKLI